MIPARKPSEVHSIAQAALTVRDLIVDAMNVCLRTGEIPHSAIQTAFPAWEASWRFDRGEYLMALDFSMAQGGPRLVRTAAPWSLLGETAACAPRFRDALGSWLMRRVGREAVVSIRSPNHPERNRGDAAIARAVATIGLGTQVASTVSSWDGGCTAALYLDSYVKALACDIELPPEGVRLAFPLWTVLLDDPALLAILHRFYPCHELLVDAMPSQAGRTLSQQTQVELTNQRPIWQDWAGLVADAPIDVVRVYVSGASIIGAVHIRQAEASNPQSGFVFADAI